MHFGFNRTPFAPLKLPHLTTWQGNMVPSDKERRTLRTRRERDRHVEDLADTAPAMLWSTGPDGSLTFISRAWYEYTGQTEAEAFGRDGFGWLGATHPEDSEQAGRIFLEANARQRPFTLDYRLRNAQGEYRWAIDSGRPRFEHTGVFLGYVGSVIEVHERKRAEEALHEARRRFDVVRDGAEVGFWFCDLPFDELNWDARVKEHFWLAPGDRVTIDTFYEQMHPRDRDSTRTAIDTSIVNKTRYETEFRTLSRQGQPKWIRAIGRTYYDDKGSPIRFDGITLDITAQRAVQDELTRVALVKDEFIATLSHELRSPMSAILGWAQVLRMHRESGAALPPATLQQALDAIERNASLQSKIIEDLLDVNTILAGKMSLAIESIDINRIVEAAVDSFRPAAEAKSLRLQVIHDQRMQDIRGDAARLQQVVHNLLSNAVKFTPKGGKVQLVCQRVNSHVEISVSDTGKGISPEFLPFIFERFRQQDASITRSFGGLGLGLSIVKQIIEMHGGTVQAASDGEGQGATFTVHLPIAIAIAPELPAGALDREHPRSPRQAHGGSAPDTIDASRLQSKSILVVDDVRDARELICSVLREHGANCLVAASAEEALEHLNAGTRVDLMISDLGMPGMSGLDLIAQVRSLPADRSRSVPAIALSAFARPEDRSRSLLAGFQLHLPKPVQISELLASILSVV